MLLLALSRAECGPLRACVAAFFEQLLEKIGLPASKPVKIPFFLRPSAPIPD